MRTLALDSAAARCSATIVVDGEVVVGASEDVTRGQAGLLPVMARDCLERAGLGAGDLDLVAVTVGPGSFTGIRGGLALAQGIAVGARLPLVGVTIGEALAEALPQLGGRVLWVAIPSRRGRIFLEVGDGVMSFAVAELPTPRFPVATAGAAAADVASRLAARGCNVMLTDARLPVGRHIALVGERRLRGQLRPLAAEPLYVDAPEAKAPAPAVAG